MHMRYNWRNFSTILHLPGRIFIKNNGGKPADINFMNYLGTVHLIFWGGAWDLGLGRKFFFGQYRSKVIFFAGPSGRIIFFITESYKYRGFRDNFMLNKGFRDNYALN